MMEFVVAILGLLILIFAGDMLVRGAVNSALRLGIPALVVSLTVVAFGTSAPELLVSVDAVLSGVPGLALGNVVGSNTANILLVLGVPAVIAGLSTGATDTRRSYVVMLAATVLFIGLAFTGPFTFIDGIFMLGLLAIILAEQAWSAVKERRSAALVESEEEDVEGADPNLQWPKIIMFLAVGLVGLPIGANLLVDSARSIAATFGVSDSVIGLTLVAIGTSLPELATTVMAAIRKQADVALGNVIGSNLFNLLAIIGIASLFGDIPVAPSFLNFDLWVMLGAALLIAPFVFTKMNLTRRWGVVLSVLYVAYLIAVVVTG